MADGKPTTHLHNCPILERTADGRSVGRCWFHCPEEVCERHGDVSEALKKYRETGELTDENDHVRRDKAKG